MKLQLTCTLFLFIYALVTAGLSAYDFSLANVAGNMVDLSRYSDAKVILIVNVASNCGYTYTNYKELSDMYDRLHPLGLEILAFPCNQFGDQEPASNSEIQTFVSNYGVSFPVFSKVDVNGPTATPLYKFLKSHLDNAEISWNFHKFLVVNGQPVKRYHSRVTPKTIEPDIVKYLIQAEL